MCYSHKEMLDLIDKFKLNPDQFILITALIRPQNATVYSEEKKYKRLNKLVKFAAKDIADLISRDILINNNDIGEMEYGKLEVSLHVEQAFLPNLYDKPSELFEAYPPKFTNDGKTFVGRNVCVEEFGDKYLKSILDDEQTHKEILELVNWANRNNRITMGLKKFVDTRGWEYLRVLRGTQGPDNFKLGF